MNLTASFVVIDSGDVFSGGTACDVGRLVLFHGLFFLLTACPPPPPPPFFLFLFFFFSAVGTTSGWK